MWGQGQRDIPALTVFAAPSTAIAAIRPITARPGAKVHSALVVDPAAMEMEGPGMMVMGDIPLI